MNILIAPDKFKGTLTADQVCCAVERGLTRSGMYANIRKLPLADGGEGTLEIFLHHKKGRLQEVEVHDPLMRKIEASYALSDDGKTAFIEMAKASGLILLKPEERNPMLTTSYGTGELIKDALDKNVEHIILGIGGSATNDAATGAAQALGFTFFDTQNTLLEARGESLERIERIETDGVHPKLYQVKIIAICDVTNPFYGEQGAAFVYGSQKGGYPEDIRALDQGLRQVATVVKKQIHIDVQQVKGAGAGGGFAGGAMALFHAELMSGVDTVFALTSFEEAIAWSDVVITGEGKLDEQTLHGKLVQGIVKMARRKAKKVLVLCGKNDLPEDQRTKLSADEIFSLIDFAGEEMALQNAGLVLEQLSETILAVEIKKGNP